MHNSRLLLFFLFFLGVFGLYAQDSLFITAVPDTGTPYPFDEYMKRVVNYHPIAKSAKLNPEEAEANLRIARGFFDPKIEAEHSQKEFKGTGYYDITDAYIKIPTYPGVDIKAGIEENEGAFLNEQNTVPDEGLTYVGLAVPIGRDLLMDQRRKSLRQADLMTDYARAEQIKIINKLLIKASKAYWTWLQHYQEFLLYENSYNLSQIRYDAVVERVRTGDMAGIDSVESKIFVQDMQVLFENAKNDYNNAKLMLAQFLWDEENVPAELAEDVVPALQGTDAEAITQDSLNLLLNNAMQNHPELLKIKIKQQTLELERFHARNMLLPDLDLEAKILQNRTNFSEEIRKTSGYADNYKLDLTFSYPLLLRKERGKIKLYDVKLQDNNLKLINEKRVIETEIRRSYNNWLNLQKQVEIYEQIVENQTRLRDGELTKFRIGESSVFLINSREAKLLSSQIKYYQKLTKYAQERIELQYWGGRIEFQSNE